LTSPTLPSYITYPAYPTLNIGPTVALTLGTTPSVTYNWYVQGISIISGSTAVYAPLTINLYHECYGLTVSSPVASTYSYTIKDAIQNNILASFQINDLTRLSCITFTLLDLSSNPTSLPTYA
jgi:hypothetical protein